MSKIAELAYDIEQLYIDGMSARMIALTLECPVEMVYGWIEGNSVADTPQEDFDPFETINS
jgi:hypothetical protein